MPAETGQLEAWCPSSRDEVLWRRGSDPDRLESRKPSQRELWGSKVCIVTCGGGQSSCLAVGLLRGAVAVGSACCLRKTVGPPQAGETEVRLSKAADVC